MSDESCMLEIQPLLTEAQVHFRNEDFTDLDVENWLHQAKHIPPVAALPENIRTLLGTGEMPELRLPFAMRNVHGIVGLDPVTGGILLAGLTALLNYLAGERRHRESLGAKKPPPIGSSDIISPELCEHVSAAGHVCGLPVRETKIIRSEGHNPYILKICSHEPEPHLVPANM